MSLSTTKCFLFGFVLSQACSFQLLAQSVSGSGDDVLCNGYAAPPPIPAGKHQGAVNRKFSQPPPIFAVTGKPFSVHRVTQDLQIRADGTRVCGVPYVTVLYRDSAGRTRAEQGFAIEGSDGKAAPSRVTLTDPVAQIVYELDMATRTAYRLHPMTPQEIPHLEPGIPVVQDPAITIRTISLGKHSFQGVDVEGQLTTTTGIIPGSVLRYASTNEVWFSSYLGQTVLQKSVNPSAQRTDAYLHVSTAAPDPSLFRIPEGWKIVDGSLAAPSAGGNAYHTAAGYQYVIRVAPHAEFRVIGAPYSAARIETTNSNLAGTSGLPPRVLQTTKIYRDPYGRSRIEAPVGVPQPGDALGAPIFPEISDPIEGVHIILDPVHKIAHRFVMGDSANPPPQVVSDTTHPGSIETSRDLGEDTIAGIKVEGTLRTYRIPAGAVGNDHELTETTESWYSPELRVIVRAKFSRIASNSAWELTNISREEPDQALFEIPADYTVADDTGAVAITVTHP